MADARQMLQALVSRLVAQLADVLTMTTGSPVRALPAVGSESVAWVLPLQVSGVVTATLKVGVTDDAAAGLSAAVLGGADGLSDADLADSLREIIGQAAAAYTNESPSPGVTIVVGTPVREPATPPATSWQHDLVISGDTPPRLVIWSDADPAVSQPAAQTTAAALADAARPPAASPRNLDVVLDLELPIMVRFGETQLTLDALSRLGVGSMIDLERSPDEPVDLLVNGRLIARGEVVVVSGSYGVRVNEVVSAADRLRSLEG